MSPHLAALLERIAAKSAVIGVMGMGYVGLPLAATFHRAGFQVRAECEGERRIDTAQACASDSVMRALRPGARI